jgi:hypothetical protein
MEDLDMAEQATCGQGLAQNSSLRAKLGELLDSTGEVLEIHMTALDLGDEAARQEHAAYQGLAEEHRAIAARLRALGDEMAAQRDLPMGRHDFRVMGSPPAVAAFGRFVELERELLAMLQERLPQDQQMLTQMRAAGGT